MGKSLMGSGSNRDAASENLGQAEGHVAWAAHATCKPRAGFRILRQSIPTPYLASCFLHAPKA